MHRLSLGSARHPRRSSPTAASRPAKKRSWELLCLAFGSEAGRLAGGRARVRFAALGAALVGWDGCAGVLWGKGSGAPVLGVVLGVAQWGVCVFVYRACGSIRGSAAGLI